MNKIKSFVMNKKFLIVVAAGAVVGLVVSLAVKAPEIEIELGD